jgi:hypothetical protein
MNETHDMMSTTSLPTRKPSDKHLVAPGVTVACYRKLLGTDSPNRTELASMVRRRFESRFVEPVCCNGTVRGGFAALALCCLAIQALQSFRSGAAQSNTERAIEKFIRGNAEFNSLRGHEHAFYVNVRNALHHQAQTDGGWRINLSGPVFEPNSLSIGAQKFVQGFLTALGRYCSELAQTTNASPLWKSFLDKMEAIIKACDSEPAPQ